MEFMTKVKIGAAAVVAIVAIILFFQNSEPATFKFLWFGPWEMSNSIMLFLTMLAGIILGLLASALLRWRKAKDE